MLGVLPLKYLVAGAADIPGYAEDYDFCYDFAILFAFSL